MRDEFYSFQFACSHGGVPLLLAPDLLICLLALRDEENQ